MKNLAKFKTLYVNGTLLIMQQSILEVNIVVFRRNLKSKYAICQGNSPNPIFYNICFDESGNEPRYKKMHP